MENVPKRPRYLKMKGILYPEMFSPKLFKEALEYKAQPGDVFISTYPKCGTTWMQNVAMYIFRKGKEITDPYEFLKLSPFIDMLGKEGIEGMPRPGAFKTHLPYSHLPLSTEAKYIFVAREPKDCCVSFFHHARSQPGFGYWDGKFKDFFELFMAGEVEYNDYFDHLLEWYPHRNDPNVFYTKFEDMKKDIKSVILKLSRFLGQEYIDAIEKDNAVLKNIIQFSRFDYMKMKLTEVYRYRGDEYGFDRRYEGLKYMTEFTSALKPPDVIPIQEFLRKGIVGDWKNHFSPEQTERINKKCMEKFKGTEILEWYPLE